MRKLIIQIPCYNEEATLPLTLSELPREVDGFDVVEWLVIDDGSSDATEVIARAWGVDHIVRHTRNRGLAAAFRTGLEECLRLGADVIVNTDGDNQYPGAEIPKLVEPIVRGQADIVIGDRRPAENREFSLIKRLLQRIGSGLVRRLSGTNVPDTVSGFRAFSRAAASRINIVSSFSYTIETVIQAGKKRLAVASVPIRTNRQTRESRLFKSIPQFLSRSGTTMLRVYAMYQPLRVFFTLGLGLMLGGAIPMLRFLWLYFTGHGDGHVQSLVLGGVLLMAGFMALLFGMVADLIACNRQLLEMTLERLREVQPTHEPPSGVSTRPHQRGLREPESPQPLEAVR